ncbi:Putative DNA-binding domain protein [uncultured archaeon]|nr:Putative DNA-binding domain protein [uncultured archaeon]
MPLSNILFESIEENTLRNLVDNQVPESKTIDYKEALIGNSDSDKREFLADVSSFANASGGYLIFGIRELSGVPVELCGLQNINADSEILRIESIIRDGIEPRIPGVSIRAVPLQNHRWAIVIRIPRSWGSPHMVTLKLRGHERFFSRYSAGKYPLDVSELKAAFLLSETISERIRNFRVERLSKIVAEETPVKLNDVPKIVLHIIPISAFDSTTRFDLSPIAHDSSYLPPINTSGWNHRYNFDGFLTYGQFTESTSAHSYSQIFRNGIIEAVEASMLNPERNKRFIPSVAYERELLSALPRYLSSQRQLGVETPLIIMLSILGIFGYTLAINRSRFPFADSHPIDRNTLLIPEILLERFDSDLAEIMKPAFDSVWNAAGWPRSMNYNETGQWIEH